MSQLTVPPSVVPTTILNHHVFQSILSVTPVGPDALYTELLSQAGGSLDPLNQLLDEYSARRAAIPKVGQGIGPKRNITLAHDVSLTLTYIAINTLPQYLVEMVARPLDHTVLGASEIHGLVGGEETLTALNDVYYMAVNQRFRVRVQAGTTGYFTIPGPPN